MRVNSITTEMILAAYQRIRVQPEVPVVLIEEDRPRISDGMRKRMAQRNLTFDVPLGPSPSFLKTMSSTPSISRSALIPRASVSAWSASRSSLRPRHADGVAERTSSTPIVSHRALRLQRLSMGTVPLVC
jgi:hypothetical protein